MIFVLGALCVALTASAQKMPTENLNETQARYYEGCVLLRDGVINNSKSRLREAMKLLDEDMMNNDRLELKDLDVFFDASKKDTASIGTHMQFTGGYAKHEYEEKRDVHVENVSGLRGVEEGEEACYVYQTAVKANGTVECHVLMGGICQMFVMTEPEGEIKLTIRDEGSRNVYEGTAYDNGVYYVEWVQSDDSPSALITIENKSDKDISFVIASN